MTQARKLIDSLIRPENYDRLDQIVATIQAELKQGSGRWAMPFDEYLDERLGDLDWEEGYGVGEEGSGEAYAHAKAYVIQQLSPNARELHDRNLKR